MCHSYNHTCNNSKYLGPGTFTIQIKSLNFKTRRFIFGNWIFSSLNPEIFPNPPTQQLKYICTSLHKTINPLFFSYIFSVKTRIPNYVLVVPGTTTVQKQLKTRTVNKLSQCCQTQSEAAFHGKESFFKDFILSCRPFFYE